MSECLYRKSNPWVEDREGKSFVLVTTVKNAICAVRAFCGDISPVCDLPEEGCSTCPIALCQAGKITHEEANQRLTEIYNAPKAQAANSQQR